MKFLFLHEPAAAGKLTIAREVAARTDWCLFHNHLTVNLALAVYDFGTLGFIPLREQIWTAVFRYALADHLPCMISSPSAPRTPSRSVSSMNFSPRSPPPAAK